MQNSMFKQTSLSSPRVTSDHHDLLDISSSSSPTINPSDDRVISLPRPSLRSNKTLVLCFDGTGDKFSDNSNVVRFFSMLVKNDPTQLVYYQPGIGTYTIPEVASIIKTQIVKAVDMMLGNDLDAHVMGGYEFLMQNYQDGDKICIFGFSRGSYTARALAGMVEKIGLIPRCNHQQVPFAYSMYSRDDELGRKESAIFKKAFSLNVTIEFVGVWDTVNSVGFIPKTLPFASRNNSIRYFRHALSLDERRVRFKPSIWKRPKQHDSTSDRGTDVKEVWFAGNHCDVGGGYLKNNTRNSLARISIRWMIRECFKAEVGILFHRETFKYVGMDPAMLYPRVLERPDIIYHSPSTHWQFPPQPSGKGQTQDVLETIYSDFVSEELEDMADAISPAHDELDNLKAWWWWILECIPQPIFHQNEENDEHLRVHQVNLGHGRHLVPRKYNINFHRSVEIRMKSDCKYVPKARTKEHTKEIEWVD